ncbi:HEPN domain-containing protein [Limimaricola litoreus]|uniref:HEPN domain-containing protein n=1 Tax=Limimaricola litoreus TaxID=2955316 RepID=UPI0020A138F9|nr:HEPN domain-containing protein [Limimaricola litoreus]
MNRQEMQSEFDRLKFQLDSLKREAGKIPDEIYAMGCQQLCINICGSLEQSLKKIFVTYGRRKSENRIHRSIEKVCESYQNPKSLKILELIGLFDDDFERSLKADWDGTLELERNHIDNLIDDRITIAHRKRQHISISTSKLENYYRAYTGVTTRIFNHFLNGH